MTTQPLSWDDDACDGAIMGIMNLTPDSFSDGGDIASTQAGDRAAQLWSSGAQWVDIGGESTRPGAKPVAAETEQARVIPAIAAIHARQPDGLISIDTRRGCTAQAALRAGAAMVNDVCGGSDPLLLETTAAHDAALVLMHMQGSPETMQDSPSYAAVVDEVVDFLGTRIERAVAAGVRREAILVDPGIGFGKSLAHNCALLQALADIRKSLKRPILLGLSRKSLLPALLCRDLDRAQRDHASHILHALCGPEVAILRVHDVAGTRDSLTLASAVAHGLMH